MKRSGILHPGLNRILAETGHTDFITLCDRGFPVPDGPERLDLALVDDVPDVLQVLQAIHEEFIIDQLIVAEEMATLSPQRLEQLHARYPQLEIRRVSHLELKALSKQSRAVVRTGDTVPYANLILVSG